MNEDVLVSDEPVVKAKAAQHKDYPLNDLKDLKYETSPDSINVLGISTTNLNKIFPGQVLPRLHLLCFGNSGKGFRRKYKTD
ncbi:MAG: hypothetical protein R2942_03820 [Ignavibacteria bacterium]